jgi:hypothetical protein
MKLPEHLFKDEYGDVLPESAQKEKVAEYLAVKERYYTPRKKRVHAFCRWCGKDFSMPRSESIDIIDKDGRFCSLRCAARYGVACVDGIGSSPWK